MEYAAGTVGRVFLIRIDHGEDLLAAITTVAEREAVGVGLVLLLGALERGRLVEGPETLELPPVPIATGFLDGREVLGIGTVVCEGGRPVLPPPCCHGPEWQIGCRLPPQRGAGLRGGRGGAARAGRGGGPVQRRRDRAQPARLSAVTSRTDSPTRTSRKTAA